MGSDLELRKRINVMSQFGRLADLDPVTAATVLGFLAEEAGTTVVEAAVVSIRTMQTADVLPPEDSRVVVSEVSRDYLSGRLQFPVSGRPLHASCHPAQAIGLMILTLENLRADHYAYFCPASAVEPVLDARSHLALVPRLSQVL